MFTARCDAESVILKYLQKKLLEITKFRHAHYKLKKGKFRFYSEKKLESPALKKVLGNLPISWQSNFWLSTTKLKHLDSRKGCYANLECSYYHRPGNGAVYCFKNPHRSTAYTKYKNKGQIRVTSWLRNFPFNNTKVFSKIAKHIFVNNGKYMWIVAATKRNFKGKLLSKQV